MIISKEWVLQSLATYGRELEGEVSGGTLVALLIKNLEAEHFQSCLDDESRREAVYKAVLSLNRNFAEE